MRNVENRKMAFCVEMMRESFNRTVAYAKLKSVPSVTPWISLGAAYRPTFCKHDCASPDFYDLVRKLNRPLGQPSLMLVTSLSWQTIVFHI
jgi:hypothetical protein